MLSTNEANLKSENKNKKVTLKCKKLLKQKFLFQYK